MKETIKKLICTVFVAITVVGQSACTPPTAEHGKVDMPGVKNFSRIDGPRGFAGDPVGFGGATESSAMAGLKKDGFASVINLRLATEDGANIEGSRATAQSVGLNYIHIPFDPGNLDPQVINDFLTAVGDKANQPVYIHCGSGTRAAALWMIGRVLEDGWDIDAAREEAEAIALKPAEAVAVANSYITSKGK